jgi:hypothetical protein
LSDDSRFPFFLKIAAVVVLAGLVGGFLLLSGGGGGEDDVAVTNPAIPTITDAGGSGPETSQQPTRQPAPPPTTVVAPAVGTQTAVIAVKPKPKPTPRPGRNPRFGRIGGPCPQQGAITFTKRYEPLVCRDGRWDRIF